MQKGSNDNTGDRANVAQLVQAKLVVAQTGDVDEWIRQAVKGETASDSMFEVPLMAYLADGGEERIKQFVASVESASDKKLGPWKMPAVDDKQIAKPGFSMAENGERLPIPSSRHQYEAERLRLMACTVVQRAIGRKIMVNVGIGFVGTANIITMAEATDAQGNYPYFVIGYQRPSSHSSWKVDFMNQGLPTITTDDISVAEGVKAGRARGNLTATYLHEQSVAIADVIFVETELHVRKTVPRAIEQAQVDPAASLQLLTQIAGVMSPGATIVVESTVYPGFSMYDALPVLNKELRKRGLLRPNEEANLAYGFHRLKPGKDLMESFHKLERAGGATNAHARRELQEYYRTTKIKHRIWDNITAVELLKDVENASMFGVLDLMSRFMKAAEVAGVNGFEIISAIQRARPKEHGGFVKYISSMQVGGYCVPKELAMLINGLNRHFGISELQLMEIFGSGLYSAAVSDHRAEDAVYTLHEAFGEANMSMRESNIYWAGVSYKHGVGDTRMAGTERGLRMAAHYGALNRATDPLVVNWPELENQRLGDPECWGHGLKNQENLRYIKVQTTDNLIDHLDPSDNALVLAVRHPHYIGAYKPRRERTIKYNNGTSREYPGLDPVKVTAQIMGREGKVLLDTFDFLSDKDIKAYLAMGWVVRGFGKGHIGQLELALTKRERIFWNSELLRELKQQYADSGKISSLREMFAEAINTIDAKLHYLESHGQRGQQNILALRWQLAKARQEQRFAKKSQQPLVELRLNALAAQLAHQEAVTSKTSKDTLASMADKATRLVSQLETAEEKHHATAIEQLTADLIEPAHLRATASMRRSAHLMHALSANSTNSLAPVSNATQTVQQARSLLYLTQMRICPLEYDLDRFIEEGLTKEAKQSVALTLRKRQDRPELTIPDIEVEHPLFHKSKAAPGSRLIPATSFVPGPNGQLRMLVDRQNKPYRLMAKWIPDLAALINDKQAFPEEWSKFSVDVPLNLRKISNDPVSVELYEDFLLLPQELREWLIQDVWGKGYILTTLEGEPQDKLGLLMEANLDPKTAETATGRGGLLYWKDTRQPVFLTTQEGIEIPVDMKGAGTYLGGNPKDLEVKYGRTITGGRSESGGAGTARPGQVPGFMSSADDIKWQERQKTMGQYHEGKTPRSICRARVIFPENPDNEFQIVLRGSPSEMRLGHVFPCMNEEDPTPETAAYILGWNNAEVLGHPITAVHLALNLDNVMTGVNYYTDTGSNIDLFTERDPRATMYFFFGYGPLMTIYAYLDMKKADKSRPYPQYLQHWLNGFLDRFLELDYGRLVRNPHRFATFRDIDSRIKADPLQAETIIDEFLAAVWEYFVPYHVLKNRIGLGYDPEVESAFSIKEDKTRFGTKSADKAKTFIENQRALIEIAQRMEQDEGYDCLGFDYPAALGELDAKMSRIKQIEVTGVQADFSEIYHLGFYKPLQQDVYSVIDSSSVMDNEQSVRFVMAKMAPTVYIDKMDANLNRTMRLSMLRIMEMIKQAEGIDTKKWLLSAIPGYAKVWQGGYEFDAAGRQGYVKEWVGPEITDVQNIQSPQDLLLLIEEDTHLARLSADTRLDQYKHIEWGPTIQSEGTLYTSYQVGNQVQYFKLTKQRQCILIDDKEYANACTHSLDPHKGVSLLQP